MGKREEMKKRKILKKKIRFKSKKKGEKEKRKMENIRNGWKIGKKKNNGENK